MRQNLDEMINKGAKLEEMGDKADNLKLGAKDFAGRAKMLSLQALIR